MEFRASAGGRRRYAAGGVGLATAALLQAVLVLLPLGILALVTPLIVGYVTGSVVRRIGGGGYGLGSTAAIAAGCGMAMGLLLLGVPFFGLFGLGFLFSAGIGAYVAAYRANH